MTELRVATRGMGKAKGVPELMRQPANPPVHATWCLVEGKDGSSSGLRARPGLRDARWSAPSPLLPSSPLPEQSKSASM